MEIIFDALTALGTIGACVISLILAYGKYRHRLDCVFIWGAPNDYRPTLLVKNLCNRTIVIKKIDIFYAKKLVASFDIREKYNLRDCAVISANTEKQIHFDADKFVIPDLSLCKTNSQQSKGVLNIVVYTSSGKRFASREKYSKNEIASLLFGYGLFGDD